MIIKQLKLAVPLGKLLFFLVGLPFFLTFQHLIFTLRRSNVVIVSPVISRIARMARGDAAESTRIVSSLNNDNNMKEIHTDELIGDTYYGLYRATSPRSYQQLLTGPVMWPSIVEITNSLHQQVPPLRADAIMLELLHKQKNQWCFSPNNVYCSPASDTDQKKMQPAPPAGIWMNNTLVRHVGSVEQKRMNRNLEFILTKPTTSLLLALLVGLAFFYWNYRIDPSTVSKSFRSIIYQHEYYRAFTGATSHFDALHLGFNSMALYALGEQLEGVHVPSIPFLLWNISLIPVTTIIMMGITWWRMKRQPNLAEQSAVGYSGVLFAWMVVSSLNSDADTCPIPFFDDICFHTYSFFGLIKFNAGPLVQLVVAQLLLKRASFVGHLAGVIAGFLWHWNLLPLALMQPCILVPAMYVGILWSRRNEDGTTDAASSALPGWTIVWRSLFVVLGLGVYVGVHWTMILSLTLQATTLFLYHTTTGCVKAILLSSILILLTDSMTFAGWFVLSDLYAIHARAHWFTTAAYMVMRITFQLAMLMFGCYQWRDEQQDGSKVFTALFGWTVLEPGGEIGKRLFGAKNNRRATSVRGFEGRGRVLGGGEGAMV